MPFIRTNLPQDMGLEQQRQVVDAIHQALVDAIGMPVDELFNLVTPYAPGQFACSRSFNGVVRSCLLYTSPSPRD